MSSKTTDSRIIWVDLEMTGLELEKNRIIEMAVVVTEGDRDLTIVAESENLVFSCDDAILDGMDEWCTKHHGESGLTQAVRESKISVTEGEQRMLKFVQEHCAAGKCPLAGNSVGMDRRFLDAYMPKFGKFLHYRTIDVSTVKELVKRWNPELYSQTPAKKESHRALDDIRESIEELRWYGKHSIK
eukprot:Clim_evm105s157 gene=Clim_evmTU105s157